ncbi:hypothetical protein [Microbacterium sp.]|uniref:hypothetical protein n=1 Tax=Microbacterium sp. TaxID=51671 RepID=UPI0033429D65
MSLPAHAAPRHQSNGLAGVALGVVSVAVGIMPWLASGGILPLQNLWTDGTLPNEMPFALLPVSQYYAVTMFVLLLLGGVFAGLARRAFARSWAAWPIGLGVLIGHIVVVVQSFVADAKGLDLGDARAVLYLGGLIGIAVVGILVAQLAFWMCTARSTGVAALGTALAAVPFANWVGLWVNDAAGISGAPEWILLALRWLPAVVVGLALVWCGLRPPVRLIVWLVSLGALWLVPAAFGAVQYGLGMRVLQGDIAEMMQASAQVFPQMLAVEWMPVVVAAGIAAVGTALRAVIGRNRAEA